MRLAPKLSGRVMPSKRRQYGLSNPHAPNYGPRPRLLERRVPHPDLERQTGRTLERREGGHGGIGDSLSLRRRRLHRDSITAAFLASAGPHESAASEALLCAENRVVGSEGTAPSSGLVHALVPPPPARAESRVLSAASPGACICSTASSTSTSAAARPRPIVNPRLVFERSPVACRIGRSPPECVTHSARPP